MLLLCQVVVPTASDAFSRSTCSTDYWCPRPIDIRRKFHPFPVADWMDHRDFVRSVNRPIQSHSLDVTMMPDWNLIAGTSEPLLRLTTAVIIVREKYQSHFAILAQAEECEIKK